MKTEMLLGTFTFVPPHIVECLLHQLTMLVGDCFMALTSFIYFSPHLYFSAHLIRSIISTTQRSGKLLKYTS
uniref:Putative salivary serpin n=1 Tax=Ixodes ricinus TaxID=34613 RepID=A0A0K8R907_IXORI